MLIQSCICNCIFHVSAHKLRNNTNSVVNRAFFCVCLCVYISVQLPFDLDRNSKILVKIHFQCLYRYNFAILKNVIAMPQFVIALPHCHASALLELKCLSNPLCDCILNANENACQSETVGGTFGICNISQMLLLN